MAGWRPPYTLEEDRKILRYIVDGDHGKVVRGDTLWKHMAEEKVVPDRTWQSLKNRWSKTIVPDLGRPEYRLTQAERTMLKVEIESSSGRWKRTFLEKKKKQQQEEGQEKHVKEEPQEVRKNGDFYSLDLDWSDADTD